MIIQSRFVVSMLQQYTTPLLQDTLNNREHFIIKYFEQGYTYHEITCFLLIHHGIILSITQLKRLLKKFGRSRRKEKESPLEHICEAVLEEIETSSCCLGYRTLWKRLQNTYKLCVKRKTVYQILQIADPEGVNSRRKQRFVRRKYVVPGPNFLWHLDGYDKLKPFGFAIHGAIDGFSRRILWLQVSTSNNNPKVIANYFLKTVSQLSKVPTLLRSDMGTENVIIAALQKYFRYFDDDPLSGEKSYIAGKSTSNQRIESWWSQMRRLGVNFWISYFKNLRDRGLYNDGDLLHVECLRYCYGNLIRYDLETTAQEWNVHLIRKQKNRELHSGKPDILYFLPELAGSQDYGKHVDYTDIDVCLKLYAEAPNLHNPLFGTLMELIFPGSRKRGRNLREDEVEFMPLSKRINNLHINGGILLDTGNVSSHSELNAAGWGPGPPCYHNGGVSYNLIDTPPESVQNLDFNNVSPQYNPVLDATENPHYFYKNKLLFEMHMERMQRNNQ